MANSLIESRRRIILNSPHIVSSSGSIVTINDAIKAKLKSCVVDINPVQSGTGDPSPDNIRPISGWTGANVTMTGKNIFNYNDRASTDSYYLDSTGTPIPSVNYYTSNFIKVKPSIYYFYAINGVPQVVSATHSSPRIAYYTEQKEYISSSGEINQGNMFLTPENCAYIKVPVYTFKNAHLLAMVTEGTTAPTTYSAFGATYPISWQSEAGTVYGGYINVKTGELTVTHGILDLGDLSWVYTNLFYAYSPSNSFALTSLDLTKKLICSCYKVVSGSIPSNPDKMITMNNASTGSSKVIRIYDTDYTNVTALKTAVTGQKLVYELATPLTYKLTPTQINTLLGTNNIWADTGDISVKYWAHP